MTEFQILTIVKNNGDSIDLYKLLDFGRADNVWEPATDRALINKLIHDGILSESVGQMPVISFNDKSRIRLQQLQQISDAQKDQLAQENAKEDRQRLHDRKMVFLTAALTTLGTVLVQLLFRFLFGS